MVTEIRSRKYLNRDTLKVYVLVWFWFCGLRSILLLSEQKTWSSKLFLLSSCCIFKGNQQKLLPCELQKNWTQWSICCFTAPKSNSIWQSTDFKFFVAALWMKKKQISHKNRIQYRLLCTICLLTPLKGHIWILPFLSGAVQWVPLFPPCWQRPEGAAGIK